MDINFFAYLQVCMSLIHWDYTPKFWCLVFDTFVQWPCEFWKHFKPQPRLNFVNWKTCSSVYFFPKSCFLQFKLKRKPRRNKYRFLLYDINYNQHGLLFIWTFSCYLQTNTTCSFTSTQKRHRQDGETMRSVMHPIFVTLQSSFSFSLPES